MTRDAPPVELPPELVSAVAQAAIDAEEPRPVWPEGRIESLIYAVSHDLGAPLRAIAVSLDLIDKRHASVLDERGMALMHQAIDGARRMQRMIERLADVSRIRRRYAPTACVPLDPLVRDAIAQAAGEIEASGAAIDIDPLPAVPGDPRQLSNLFGELLANALRFARPDVPPHIEIRSLPQQRHIVIAVRDNGLGVPPHRAARIFEPFRRMHPADSYPGLGIGLTLCREIAEVHRGFIYAYPNPQPGTGLTVVVGLPDGSVPGEEPR